MSNPIEIEIEAAPNTDVITALTLGPITYTYPTTYTTNKISEIVVADLPIGISRMNELFSGIVTGSQSTTYSTNFDAGGNTTTSNSTNNATSSYLGRGVWDVYDSSSFFPVLDFFPRYDQWFASVNWPYPFSYAAAPAPPTYRVYFVYIDKVQKITYWTEGFVKLVFQAKPDVISPLTADLEYSAGNYVRPFSYALVTTGENVSISVTNLPTGLAFDSTTNLITGTVQHPNPGLATPVPPASIIVTNTSGSVTRRLNFNVIDATLADPEILNANVFYFGTSPGSVTFQIDARTAPGKSIASYSVVNLVPPGYGNGAAVLVQGVSSSGLVTLNVDTNPLALSNYHWQLAPDGSIIGRVRVGVVDNRNKTASLDITIRKGNL